MIKINGSKTIAVKSIRAIGEERVTITMEDDLDRAVAAFRAVEVIEAEALNGQECYLATNGCAELLAVHRIPNINTITITLQGIAKVKAEE